jgi:hypothetical protein
MMRPRGSPHVAKRSREQPLLFQIAPGVVAARSSQTVIILEPIDGSQVRVRDVASEVVYALEMSSLTCGPNCEPLSLVALHLDSSPLTKTSKRRDGPRCPGTGSNLGVT